jgi:hypothetical protein
MVLETQKGSSSTSITSSHPGRQPYFPSLCNCAAPGGDGGGASISISSSIPTVDGASSIVLPPPRTVRSVVNGIFSPFLNCVQPPVNGTCGGAPTKSWEARGGEVRNQLRPSIISPDCSGRYGTEGSLSSQHEFITQPSLTDVLCGRGGSSSRHTGNLLFRELIAANKANYSNLTKKQKMMVARQIVDLIHGSQGRFLARNAHTETAYWCDIGLPRSLEKTSQALREKNSGSGVTKTRPIGVLEIDPTDVDDQADSVFSFGSYGSDQLTQATQATQATQTTQTTDTTAIAGNQSGSNMTSSRNMQAPPITIPPHLQAVYAPRSARHGQPSRATTAQPDTYPPIPRLPDMSPYSTFMLPFRVSPQSQFHGGSHGPGNFEPPPPPPPPPPPSLAPLQLVAAEMNNSMTSNVDDPVPAFASSSSSVSSGKNNNNGPASVMRVKSEISPARQPTWKRRRTTGTPRLNADDKQSEPLEYAIQSQLSLEERVIRPLTSPAALHQGRSGARSRPLNRTGSRTSSFSSSAAAKSADLDGLAALSTAAFLRLDESR